MAVRAGGVFAVVPQLETRWSDLGPLAAELAAIPSQYLPEATLAELQLAQQEYDNHRIVTECLTAVEQGFVTGTPGHLNMESIHTSAVVRAISLAHELRCRTAQASWMSQVTEAVLELRLCVRDSDFKNLLRTVLAVRALDNVHVDVSVWLVCVWEGGACL